MKSLNKFLNLLIFGICLVAGVAFYYLNTRPVVVAEPVKPALTTEQMDELVNKHLRKTVQSELAVKFRNEKTMSELKEEIVFAEQQRRLKEDQDNANIPKERQIWKAEPPPIRNASEQIKDVINETIEQDKLNDADKKEYAREWISNAKKAGYLLELSPDLEVIKYVPIRKPSQQDDSVQPDQSD